MNKRFSHIISTGFRGGKTKLTKELLAEAFEEMKKRAPAQKELVYVAAIKTWKFLRDNDAFCFAHWTDEELENYNKETREIGVKCGVRCYVWEGDHFMAGFDCLPSPE